MTTARSTQNPRDHDHFTALAGDWWTLDGPLKTLHQFNPARLSCLLRAVGGTGRTPLKGMSLLDVGCGGGIFAESLARAGANVTGIDTVPEAIAAAKAHQAALKIDYQVSTVEEWAKGKARYDIITASEVIEHVSDPALFIESCAKLLKPGGLLFITTLNRTAKSFALAIVAGEYVLGLAPKGTHEWQKFMKPSELAELLAQHGIIAEDRVGLIYNPLTGRVTESATRVGVNYALWGRKR